MPGLTKRTTPDRSKIDIDDAKQLKYWLKLLRVSKEDLVEAIDKVGNAAAIVRKELQRRGVAMPDDKKPLEPEDFPVNADGKQIKKQDGTPIAETQDPKVATDVADRLNEDEASRRGQVVSLGNSKTLIGDLAGSVVFVIGGIVAAAITRLKHYCGQNRKAGVSLVRGNKLPLLGVWSVARHSALRGILASLGIRVILERLARAHQLAPSSIGVVPRHGALRNVLALTGVRVVTELCLCCGFRQARNY